MRTRRLTALRSSADGFTLIEVIGALVIFSMGVLMIMNSANILSVTMGRAALRSELAVLGQERLDSLELVDYSALTLGETTSTSSIRGQTYEWVVSVEDASLLIRQVEVTGTPYSGTGPSFSGTAYVDRSW